MTSRPPMLLILAVAVLTAAGCSSGAKPVAAARKPSKPRVIEQSTSGTLVQTSPATAAHFHLVRARAVNIAQHFTAPGSVASDVSRTVTVYSLADGFAVKVPVELGQKVRKNQLLAVVNSPALATAISTYQTAQAQENLDDKALAREQTLFQHGAAPRAAVQTARYADQHARILMQAAVRQIRLLGGDPTSASALVQVRAPISGTIIDQNISNGQAVEHSYLFKIADLSRVWVLCSIYENQLSRVQVGDDASLKFAAYPHLKISGRITNVSRILNANTRTATVRVVLNNPQGRLMPGMFATATFTSIRKSPHIIVPVTALFQLHNQYWVFRPVKTDVYRRVPVSIGTVDTPGWETVTEGLRPGQRVISDSFGFAAAAAAQKQ